MRNLSEVEILSLTAILKAETDGLKMQKALNKVITDEDLKRQSEAGILAAERRLNGLIQFIKENNLLTKEELN
ncbi:MAG: hypothetical protein HUJ77_08115 [Clostridium sp.]|uniref:hypothetical protein n=1 Tax=Clostridium sp. TaxID=1506 RepID=UPI0025BAF2C1|nr:hypothetical protein [Clostridium sp.]MCF0148348.1 hypothetical protein [Clostridium sp.]